MKVRFIQTIMIALMLGVIYLGQDSNTRAGVMNINGALFLLLTNMTFSNMFAVVQASKSYFMLLSFNTFSIGMPFGTYLGSFLKAPELCKSTYHFRCFAWNCPYSFGSISMACTESMCITSANSWPSFHSLSSLPYSLPESSTTWWA